MILLCKKEDKDLIYVALLLPLLLLLSNLLSVFRKLAFLSLGSMKHKFQWNS